MKLVGMFLLLVGVSGAALAISSVPEIDSGSIVSALALVSGSLLVIKSRRKK